MKRLLHKFSWLSRHEFWVLPLTLGLTYFILQFSLIAEYGATWDEPLHLNWGLLYSVFLKTGDRSVLYMMPGNGVYYSPLYFIMNYELTAWLLGRGWELYQASHVLNILTSSFVVALSYVLGRFFGGWKTGLLTVVFFIGFPQFIAHSHYNPKDIPLLLMVLVTSIAFLYALRRNSYWLFFLSAALFGCSIAAKVTALMLAPVFLLSYLLWLAVQPRVTVRRTVEKQLLIALTGLLLVLAFTVLCWPSSWGDLHLILSAFAFFLRTDFWSGTVMFFGQTYAGAELPWFYTPLEYLMGMPLLMIVAFAAGTAFAIRRLRTPTDRPIFLYLVLWIFLPLVLTAKPGLVRYDGMRQFFFTLPAVAVLSAIGFQRFLRFVATRFRYAEAVFVLVLLLSFAYEATLFHPFEGSYRNEVVRAALPENMEKSIQLEYWGATYKQGLDWLTEHAEPNPEICVPTAGLLVDSYSRREDFSFNCSRESDYLMFFTRYAEPGNMNLSERTPVYTIERAGAALLKIYQL